MIEDILALLKLFEERVPDKEIHEWVTAIAADEKRWPEAHEMFSRVRRCTLNARDHVSLCQYGFEEICLKCLYNETATDMPFDHDSPHWITKNALSLARALGMHDTDVVNIIAPK